MELHPFVVGLLGATQTKAEEVLSLAKAIDAALDDKYGYGTSVCDTSLTSPEVYGEIANMASAAFALAALQYMATEASVGMPTTLFEAVHDGWAYSVIHCGDFRSSEVREEKLKLVALPFWLLSFEEKSKDVVAVAAITRWVSENR